MNERIRSLRKALGVNQRDFSSKAKIGHSTLAMFETGQRVPKDIHISQICQTFNVNEEWLRNGTGSMFVENDSAIVSSLAAEYNLDSLEQMIIQSYLNLTPQQRAVIKDFALSLVATFDKNKVKEKVKNANSSSEITATTANHIDTEVENYRSELEAEQKGEMSSALEDIKKEA